MGLRTWLGLKKTKARRRKGKQSKRRTTIPTGISNQAMALGDSLVFNRDITKSELVDAIGRDATTILEIGANNGGHTRLFLDLFPHATIYAFEPDPRALKEFKSCISSPRARLFEMAIGAEDGITEFYQSCGLPPGITKEQMPEEWHHSGSLRAPKTHLQIWPWCKFEKKTTVPVRRLDTWARENSIEAVDFIWADVQGAERDLIAGGAATLAKTRLLYTEWYDNELYEGQWTLAQIVEALPTFKVVAQYPTDVMLRNMAIENTS